MQSQFFSNRPALTHRVHSCATMIEVWTVAILALVLFMLAVYHCGFRNVNYFKNHGIPYLPPKPFLGNMAPLVFRKKSFVDIVSLTYNCDPDAKYVGFFDFLTPVVILRDPELIKSVTIQNFDHFPDHKVLADEVPDPILRDSLFGSQGQRWKDTRALLSPSFTSSKMKTLFKLVKECTVNLIEHMKTESEKSTVFEMHDILRRYTNDTIATTAFGIGVNSHKSRENELFMMGEKATNFSGGRSIRLFILRTFPRLAKFLGVNLFGKKIANFYKHIIEATVTTRDTEGVCRPDMLQLMMQARYSDKNNVRRMRNDEMSPHAFIFYFAGFDTTSNLMSFAVHEITVNPEVHQKLQAEVDEVLERCSGEITYNALHAMEYLDAVINETLRLHSPAIFVDRLCRKELELPPAKPGLKPFTIKPGSTVGLPLAAIQLDPKYFPSPGEFNPERFIGPEKNNINPATFIPFGIGPRICIGNRFALMETKLVVFELLANFNLMKCSKTDDPLKLNCSSFLLKIDSGIWLQAEPRNQ